MDITEGSIEPGALAAELQAAIVEARRDAQEDPFGNPVLSVALWLTRRMDRAEITTDSALELVRHLGRQALAARAGRTAAYVGLTSGPDAALGAIAHRLANTAFSREKSFAHFAASVQRVRFAAVFTAHPTFGMSRKLSLALAALASGDGGATAALDDAGLSFRPDGAITLQDEF